MLYHLKFLWVILIFFFGGGGKIVLQPNVSPSYHWRLGFWRIKIFTIWVCIHAFYENCFKDYYFKDFLTIHSCVKNGPLIVAPSYFKGSWFELTWFYPTKECFHTSLRCFVCKDVTLPYPSEIIILAHLNLLYLRMLRHTF